MKIIDAHVHYSRVASFEDCALQTSTVDYTEKGYHKELESNEVVHTVCMGLTESVPAGFPDKDAKTPMRADLTEEIPYNMSLCLGINPHTLNENSLAETEEQIICGKGKIVGMKIYAGYYHVDINDPIYDPVYKLAEKHDLTITVHTGETFSTRGLLKYAHPLNIDELAVSHPQMRIMACHMGVPWIFDACEVAIKNPNVYVDISGIFIGNTAYIERQSANQLLIDRYSQALTFLDNYDKVLYGTDWPLVPMAAYIDLCKKIVPPEEYSKVFYENAIKVFKLSINEN